jgi:hypothetical protein
MALVVRSWFRKKPPLVSLRVPRRARQILQWSTRRGKWTYVTILCFGKAISVVFAVSAVVAATHTRKQVPVWLVLLETVMGLMFCVLLLHDAVERALKSWNRRHALS